MGPANTSWKEDLHISYLLGSLANWLFVFRW